MIAASRQTLIANLVQQACAATIILTLPNILSKADFAQVVYVGVLLSFAAFADLGISLVYGRIVPALHTAKATPLLANWNATTLKFGLLSSSIYACVIALLYLARFGNYSHAAWLLPVPLLVFWFSFHVSRASSTGDFSEYRKSITWRALGSLLVLPLSLILGLLGWFIGTLAAATLTLGRLGKRLKEPMAIIDWTLIRTHWREGLLLACVSILWIQLLNFARLYASFTYNTDNLATYGIIASAYQSVSTLLISVFLPISVGILGRYGESERHALDFAQRMITRSVPWTTALTLIGLVLSSPILHACFPTYQFDKNSIHFMLLCLLFQPFHMVWGNVLIANKHTLRYLLVIIAGLVISIATARYIDHSYTPLGAAAGQLAGVAGYTILLGATAWASTTHRNRLLWQRQGLYLIGMGMLCAIVIKLLLQ